MILMFIIKSKKICQKNKNYIDIIKVLSLKNNGIFQLNINHKEQYKNKKFL